VQLATVLERVVTCINVKINHSHGNGSHLDSKMAAITMAEVNSKMAAITMAKVNNATPL
jgi:hypothetical protein